MSLSTDQIRQIAFYMLALVISVALHEFGHAVTAHKLGDDTPSRQGRVTLNPLAHADPIGTLLLPLVSAIYGASTGFGGGFGWGRPVQWQPHRIRRGISMNTASILVSIAGPSMNLLLGTVSCLVYALLIDFHAIGAGSHMTEWFSILISTNFVLFFFNLIPLPPLDGGHVIQALVPLRHRRRYEEIAKYGPFILLGLMLIPQIRRVISIPAFFLADHIFHGFVRLFA